MGKSTSAHPVTLCNKIISCKVALHWHRLQFFYRSPPWQEMQTVPFKLNFAPHEGMFQNPVPEMTSSTRLVFAYDQGFRSIEG